MRKKLHIGNSSKMSHNSSGSFTSKTLQTSKVSGPKKMASTEKEKRLPSISSTKIAAKKLQRRGTIIHDDFTKKKGKLTPKIKRVTNSLTSVLQFSKKVKRQGKADEKELLKQKLEFVVNNEKTPISDSIDLYDQFVDENFDMQKAIVDKKNRESKLRKAVAEWSGQDVISALEPYKANIYIEDLSNIRVYRRDLLRKYHIITEFIKYVVKSPLVENFMTFCVVLNTLILAIDHYGIDPNTESLFNTFNLIFTIIFCVEMVLKLVGLGVKRYLQDTMNYLDGSVVILSMVELIFLSGSGGALTAFRAVRIFRTFRVIRVARLLRSMQSMQVIIGVIGRSLNSFFYLALLILIFVFIYSLMGMQLFEGIYKDFSDGTPRANFDSFTISMITCFQILTIENWQSILFPMVAQGGWSAAIYLISWIFLGNYVLLNLFLAILLDSFVEEDEEEKKEQQEQDQLNGLTDQPNNEDSKQNEIKGKRGDELLDAIEYQVKIEQGHQSNSSNFKKFVKKSKKKKDEAANVLDESIEINNETLVKKQTEVKPSKPLYEGVECDIAFFFIKKQNIFRIWIYKFVQWTGFETIIMIAIICSSLKLIMDTYILNEPDDAFISQFSAKLDNFFIAFFTLECLLKSIAYGFIFEKGSYLRESWNMLDFFIVCTSIIDLAFDGINLPVIKILRLLRTIRPLRFISHNSGIKIIVEALLQSLGHIFNVAIVVWLVWLMFAILGVNLFGGKFQYCDLDTYNISTSDECRQINGNWLTYGSHFDNVPAAMLTLFVLSSQENWPSLMYQGMDSTGVETGPQINASLYYCLYFITFMIVGNFFFLNFFVGVIFLNFEEAQKEEKESFFLNDKQLKWIDMMKMIVSAKPDLETIYIPKNKCRKLLHYIVISNYFDVFIMVCIVLNMCQMAIDYEDASDTYELALYYINLCFTSIFTVECILKLTAFGLNYFTVTWNNFDFFVVLSSIIEILFSALSSGSLSMLRVGPQLARVLRVLRVSRILRLINKYQGLQTLIQTITFSISSLFNVFILLLLVFFIYSVLGVFIFNEIKYGAVISEYRNFHDFGQAMLILLVVSTGEDWNMIMYDCSRTPPDCIPGETCGLYYAPLYFTSFITIVTFVLLNLFILVIMQQFDKYYLPDDNVLQNFKGDLEAFKTNWSAFAQEYNGVKIKDHWLVDFFYSLSPPLGFKGIKGVTRKDVVVEILKMDLISDPNGFIYFNELLFKSMRRVYGEPNVRNINLANEELNTLKKLTEIRKKMIKKSIKDERESIKVNPFLTLMYYKMSFKAWRSRTRKNELMRRNGQVPGEFIDESSSFSSEDSEDNKTEYSERTFRMEEIIDEEEEEKKH